MGIILSALAGAGDAGADSMDKRIKQYNQIDLDERRSALEERKALTILAATKQAQIDTANQLRTEQVGRLASAKEAVIQQQLGQKYAPVDAAVAAADAGQTDAPLTPEQRAVIDQSKAIDLKSLADDPKAYIAAAMQTGDLDAKTIAEIVQQGETNRRMELSQQAGFAHADKAAEAQRTFMAGENAANRAATASLREPQIEANKLKAQEKRDMAEMTKASQVASFDTMLGTLDRLSKHPGLPRSVGTYSMVPTMPGSDSANFQAELDTFQSQAFIPMVAQLKGMGALSDAEGKKLTAAVGALSLKMDEEAFKESLGRVITQMEQARTRVASTTHKPSEQAANAPADNGGWSIQQVN